MKRILTATMIAGLALAPTTYANDAHHPDKEKASVAAAAQPAKAPADQTAQRMQENVKRMQSQLDGVRKANDPAQLEKLLAEHMQTMRENMMLGNAMMQGRGMGMMGGQGGMGMMGGHGGMGMMDQCMKMMGGMSGAGPADASARLDQMEKRMDMMQMMMGQMAGRAMPASAEPAK